MRIMPKVVYICADGSKHIVHVPVGTTAMQAAVNNMVPGIDGDCGGHAACGTCHVFVDPAWIARTGSANAGAEADILSVTDNAAQNSRLACQIEITAELDGLILSLPEAQH
jgi:2Fe-2S ferredoxin